MTQLTFLALGVWLGLGYGAVLRRRRLLPLTALAVGAGGAWSGALLAATVTSTGWRSWGPLSLLGALVGGVGALVLLDLMAGAARRGEIPE